MATTKDDILRLMYKLSRDPEGMVSFDERFTKDLHDHRPLRDHILEAMAGEVSPPEEASPASTFPPPAFTLDEDWRTRIEENGLAPEVGVAAILGDVMLDHACPRVGHNEEHTCPACDGSGWVLTGAGRTLLHFLRRHWVVQS